MTAKQNHLDSADEMADFVARVVGDLRPRLLDLSRRNPLINTRRSSRSNAHVWVVDELPDVLRLRLSLGESMRFVALPPISSDPLDEQTKSFQEALAAARLTDETYSSALDQIGDATDPNDAERLIERHLRDKVRQTLGLMPRPSKIEVSIEAHAKHHGIAPNYELPEPHEQSTDGRHDDNLIQTLLLPDVLDRKLSALVDKGREWRQETGIDVFRAAFGFVSWIDTKSGDKGFSPLVMLDVDIARRKGPAGAEYWVESRGEPAQLNAVLAVKMRNNFGIELPQFENGSLEDYFTQVSDLAPASLEWAVRRQVAFGVFPSARIAMYEDLNPQRADFSSSVVVRTLLAGAPHSEGVAFADEYENDQPEIEKKVPYIVKDCDSSQFSALVDIKMGRNLALEGPPGTGKSQTIVNAIACAIADGKKVLFVASKSAALEVVKSRLTEAGLGEFVLALQAGRSSREQVISSLRERLEMEHEVAPRDLGTKIKEMRRVRDEISQYIALLSSEFGQTGLTVHEILGKAIASSSLLEGVPTELQSPPPPAHPLNRQFLDLLRHAGAAVEKAWREASCAKEYWRGSALPLLDRLSLEAVGRRAFAASEKYRDADQAREALGQFWISRDLLVVDAIKLQSSLRALDPLGVSVNSNDLRRVVEKGSLNALKEFAAQLKAHRQNLGSLSSILKSPISSEVADRLRQAHALCKRYRINSLDLSLLHRKRAHFKQRLDSDATRAAVVESYVESFPGEESRPLSVLSEAKRFITDWPIDVLRRRNAALNDAGTVTRLQELCENGRAIAVRKIELEKVITTSGELDHATLIEDCAIFRGANLLSPFSSEYRAAKRRFLSRTRRTKFKLTVALADLTALHDWREAQRRLSADMNAFSLSNVGPLNGSTEFEKYETIVNFYNAVRTAYTGADRQAIRDFILDAPTDQLISIPEFEVEQDDKSYADLQAAIKSDAAKIDLIDRVSNGLARYIVDLKSPSNLSVDALPEIIAQLDEEVRRSEQINNARDLQSLLSEAFQGAGTDIRYVESLVASVEATQLAGDYANASMKLFEAGLVASAASAIDAVLTADRAASAALLELAKHAFIPIEALKVDREYSAIAERLVASADDLDGLRAHAAFHAARKEFESTGYGWAISTLFDKSDAVSNFGALLEALAVRQLVIDLYHRHGPILAQFTGTRLDECRARFAILDSEIIKLNRQSLRAKCRQAANPEPGIGHGPKSSYTEASLIRHQVSLTQKFAPVRELVSRAGQSLREFKPCWMMSPLAVAQYVSRTTEPFDLVIIDEASQMPPEEAIGALSRGRQAMIVGDVNQLPPSNFFRRVLDGGDGDDGAAADLCEESILELANAAFRPARRLRWHYRSRHSSLIQFCNHHIYDGKLVVFPSPVESRPSMGVSIREVDGVYGAGINQDEAREMIRAALDHMRTDKRRSLGLVVMNQKQKELVRQEWEYALANDSAAQEYVDYWMEKDGGLEEFFIKNLENVQGDERDVIFIGTVYGPEQRGGPVMQRFSGFNGAAGRRRLNVLFTRAKEQIVTFTSMSAADIRADENGNAGVYMMKRWLEYSKTGRIEGGRVVGREPDSDFELHVADQIRAMGCEAVPQVGVRGYWIDIGVRHPEWPHSDFILGVECDGATYHSSKTARDRDRLRQEVLERLGWRLHRIWSTDWFSDPRKEAEKLRRVIEARLSEFRGLNTKDCAQATPAVDRAVRNNASVGIEAAKAHVPATTLLEKTETQPLATPRESARCAAVGDMVRVRYLNGTKSMLQFTLSEILHEPNDGLVRVSSPVGRAVLGAEEGDEVEVLDGSYVRLAVIEKIEKRGHKQLHGRGHMVQ